MKRSVRNKIFSAWDVVWIEFDRFRSTFRSRLSLWFQGCSFGCNLRTTGSCYFKARREGSIKIGRNVIFLAGHRSNRVGLSNPVLLETFGNGVIEIGDYSGGSAVCLSSRSHINIGKYVKMGGNVRIYDHDFHALDASIRRTDMDKNHAKTEPVVIEDDVFLGAGVTVLKGVTVRREAIVAAGSVIVTDIPAGEVWGGNPARCIRQRSETGFGNALT